MGTAIIAAYYLARFNSQMLPAMWGDVRAEAGGDSFVLLNRASSVPGAPAGLTVQ